MSDYPEQRHPNCTNDRCKTCLQDADNLMIYLEGATGDTWHDLLGKYRSWLDNNDIYAETEHGWPSINVYLPENIDAFVEYWKDR